jgi:hypothetical protein
MPFMKPKIPPAPSPEDIARMQDKIAQEREAKRIQIESDIKRKEASAALRSKMRKRKGRGTLVTKKGGSTYVGLTDDPLAPQTSRSLLGQIGG